MFANLKKPSFLPRRSMVSLNFVPNKQKRFQKQNFCADQKSRSKQIINSTALGPHTTDDSQLR